MGFNLKSLSNRTWLTLTGAAIILFVIVGVAYWPKNKESLVIDNGVEYKLLSYGKAEPILDDGTTLDAYVLMVTYEDPKKGLTRGTIMVPTSGIKHDLALPKNTVIWDKPLSLEGKYYASARWNPRYSLPARERPALIEEPPLTRKD